jgi:flagellar hook-associated protein 2
MGTTATTAFTGNSTFSQQLQQVVTRAVGLATLPITQLQNQRSKLTDQQSELQTLGSQFQSVQNALDSIDTSAGSGLLSATVSNQPVATAALSAGALPGTYGVNILSLGSLTNTLSSNSLPAVSDPATGSISSSATFTVTADGISHSIAYSGNSLTGLAQAINASGAGVQATVVNVGGSSSPDYRLSIQGTRYASSGIQLNDGTQDLLDTISAGSSVTYQVNGQPAAPASPISSDTRSFSISPGITVTALETGSTNVTVARSGSDLANTISGFVAAYNSASAELQKNRGQNGGALAGQNTVSQLTGVLQSLTGYSSSSSGNIHSLADLGLTFDQTGTLQFDQSVFSNVASGSLNDALSFLGSADGGGFLQLAKNSLSGAVDSTNGLITQQSQSIGSSIINLGTKISAEQESVTQMQTNLTTRLANADALIASLEQQVSQITALFAAAEQQSRSISG